MPDNTTIYRAFKQTLDSYTPISDTTWYALKAVTQIKRLEKNQVLYQAGDIPATFAWVFHGLIRGFVCDEKGNEYNKKFFDEGMFPGAMSAMLTNRPSKQGFDALEETFLIEIDFLAYRRLLLEYNDLRLYQIYYLEKNWLLDKDEREIAIVQLDASARYQQFLSEFPSLVERLPQYHIASHLGITPTQLSRIRKKS
ncbi:MAG: CRP-like cAMP-binding protein [Candidatus Azotimanducaceae bacterium]|jgi:CRP-like cAMP-binding protein